MKLSEICISKLNAADISFFFPIQDEKGIRKFCKCPKCGTEGKKKGKFQGMSIVEDHSKNKRLVKCQSCGFGAGGGTINILMKTYGYEFMEACHKISDETGIQLDYETKTELKSKSTVSGNISKYINNDSFAYRQLTESGLTPEDVIADVYVNGELTKVCPFRKGKIDVTSGRVDEFADDMIILYYDLEGRRRSYRPSGSRSREQEYTRVRWQNPEAHANKKGKPVKYQTPLGAKTELYIPQKIRSAYLNKIEIETLFIQEGEKKAEKACKHGLPSIAIQGIGNLGNKETGLPEEIQYLVQTCKIKNIVFLMDADWNDLKRDLVADEKVESRPRSFASALIKFRKYIGTLAKCGIFTDIWFAHVNENESGDKGIDDLLNGTLKGNEESIREDIDSAMLSHDGKGEFVDVINISSFSDSKIIDIWKLNSKDDFFEIHKKRLLPLKSFKFGDVFYRVDGDKIVTATDVGSGKEFWSYYYDDKGKMKIELSLVDMLSFLESNGFRSMKGDDSKRSFVKIDDGIISVKDEHELRKFVLAYVARATRSKEIINYITESITSKLSASNISLIEELVTAVGKSSKYSQKFFFRDCEITVKADSIESGKLIGPVWRENIINREFSRIPIFMDFHPDSNGGFEISLTEDGKDCEFLTYLFHTSDNYKGSDKDEKALRETSLHVANKILALGYMLRDYKSMSEAKAVVAMDATMSEVGTSMGRTGKSLVGVAISRFIRQTVIDGRNLTNDDQYMFSGVSRTTKNIFIDDISESFDFGRFYQRVTGDLNVNVKMGARFVIDFDRAPKFYFTTNHAISNIDDSARARILFTSFSDWYSSQYTPVDEFGHMFFSDWDDHQWELFDNLMIECVMLFMRSAELGWAGAGRGAIDTPLQDIMRRTLRQQMGELFVSWAENYFDPEGQNVNKRIIRKNMFEAFLSEYNIKATAMSAKNFRSKLIAYCQFAGLHLNAHKPDRQGRSFEEFKALYPDKSFIGEPDKGNSLEFYTVNTDKYLNYSNT